MTGLTGSFAALWLAHTGVRLPLAIYVLRNFIARRRATFEAAAIDGAARSGPTSESCCRSLRARHRLARDLPVPLGLERPLAVFFGLQRYFVRGLLAGSVKG